MNKRYFLLIILSVFANIAIYGQGATCADASPFCTGSTTTFPNTSDGSSAPAGIDYGCLSSQPNPVWYYMQIDSSGTLEMTISQTANSGASIDVDFVLWGPFNSLNDMCNNLTGACSADHNCSGNIVDCSFSASATEIATIPNAQTGEFYMMLITNYDGAPGTIDFSQTGGTASTNCDVLNPCNAYAGQDTSMCVGESFLLGGSPAGTGNGNISYSWSPSIGLNDSTLSNPIANPSQTTTYYLTTVDDSNCVAYDSVIVEVFQYPIANAGTDDTLKCTVAQLVLDGTGSIADTYFWTTADGNIVSGGNSSAPNINAPGTYVLMTQNGGTCTDYDTVVVFQDVNLPIAEAGVEDTLNCINSSLSLDGTGSSTGSNITYLWTGVSVVSGSTSLTPSINQPGVYTLTVTDNSNGCESSDMVTISLDTIAPLVSINSQNDICHNDTLTLSASSNGDSYQWVTTGGVIKNGDTTLFPHVQGSGTYTLTSTNNSNGCLSQVSIIINEIPVSSVISANPMSGLAPLTVDFSNGGIADSSYWDFGNGQVLGDTNNVSSETIVYDEQGNYTVTLTSFNNGCQSSAQLIVEVIGASFITVPNVFTPNGDGQNDVFKFIYQNISELNCVIFNRWGKKVAELTKPDSEWKGFVNGGGKASDGTYFYILKAKGTDDEVYELKGTVSLIR